jgi:membrane protein required for colicin V production
MIGNIPIIDIVFAAIILVLAIRGAFRGIIEELSAMAALVLGIMAALAFRAQLGGFIRGHWASLKTIWNGRLYAWLPDVLAFLGILVAVYFVIKLVGVLLKEISRHILLGGLDHFLGLAFGALEGLTAVALLLSIIQALSKSAIPGLNAVLDKSYFATDLLPAARSAVDTFINVKGTAGSV